MRLIIILIILILNGCTSSYNIFSDCKNFKIIKKEYTSNYSKANGKYIYTIQSSFHYNLTHVYEYDNFKIISDKDFELGEELILTTNKLEKLQ